MWGGNEEKRKIAWVSWEVVCRSKDKGGLGLRELNLFNLSLLGKWSWRLLVEKEALWSKVPMARYGALQDCRLQSGNHLAIAPTWWRDLNKSRYFGDFEDWFKDGLRKLVGDGCETSFWRDTWAGQVTLATHFERLFQISNSKNHTIAEMGSWCNGNWSWNFSWRRTLFVWEENLLLELLEQIKSFGEHIERKDQWV